MSEPNGPRKDPRRTPSHEPPGGLPANRPVWGRGRPVVTPFLGALALVAVILGIFALYTFLR